MSGHGAGRVIRALAPVALLWIAAAPAADPPKAPRFEPPKGVTYGGGDGTSCDRAIVIQGASGAEPAVLAQKAWLQNHHPGYRFEDTQLEDRGPRKLEKITIETAGKPRTVCFDITESFATGRLR